MSGDDYTVGVEQAASPDRWIDNEEHVNSDGVTVARQKVAAPRTDMFVSQLVRVLHRLGLSIDTASRQRVSLEAIGSGLTLGTVTTVSGVTTVTTVTTCSTVTNQAQLGGVPAGEIARAQENIGARLLRAQIAVSA